MSEIGQHIEWNLLFRGKDHSGVSRNHPWSFHKVDTGGCQK